MRDLPDPNPERAVPVNHLIELSRHLQEHSRSLREESLRLRTHFHEVCARAGRLVSRPTPGR